MRPAVSVYPNLESLSRAAAEKLGELGRAAVEQRGRFTLVLAGGSTPRRLYELLSRDYQGRVPWTRAHLFWGDERFVPPDDPRSNYALARETLLSCLPLPVANVHPIPTQVPSPTLSAEEYERALRAFFDPAGGADWPVFDVVLLGVGVDGHTASLFPGSPALAEKRRWVRAVEAPAPRLPRERITLTLPVVHRARQVVFLAAGAEKRDVIRDILTLSPQAVERYPAARACLGGPTNWLLDRAAWGDADGL